MRKTGIVATVLGTTALALSSASAARADQLIVTNVPFPFVVGDVRLPSGQYIVREESGGGGDVLLVASADRREAVFTLTIPAPFKEAPRHPELTFEKLRGEYFLEAVNPQDGEGREIVLTPSVVARGLEKSASQRR